MKLRPLSVLLLCGLRLGAAAAQQSPTLTFHFERPGLPVPEYTLAVHPDGSGTYAAQYAGLSPQPSRFGGVDAGASASVTPESVTLPIQLSAPTAAKLFERARTVGYFEHPCESKAKNIANSGTKMLTYAGPDGRGSCTFNYTENKLVAGLNETFAGIAYTLEEGHTLASRHRFDHLGLDSEMTQLAEAVKAGRALEVGVIASVLRSIADDPQLLERVRARAAELLAASSGTNSPQ